MAGETGVFICSCGPNIGGKIAMGELADLARTLPGVTEVHTHSLLCSAEGQAFLSQRIRESSLKRVVVAGCSPREHEKTFQEVLEEAGLNPFLLQMANIREQCAWVTPDSDQAFRKARSLLQAAIERVREHQPIHRREVEVNPDVLVLGAGVAGLSAALHLAGRGRRVHLVEQAPVLGGKAVLYEKVFPGMECGSCLVSPWIDRLLHEKSVEVHLLSEIRGLWGSFGHFEVELHRRARGVDPGSCLGCGACGEVCPVRVKNEHLQNRTDRPAIYIPYPGAQPAQAVLDRRQCLYHRDGSCAFCREACPMGAVRLDQEDDALLIRVGALVLATGFTGVSRSGLWAGRDGRRPAVLSGLEAEVLLNSGGPTGGRLLLPDGRPPERVGILADWAGNGQSPSALPCNPLLGAYLKLARQIKEQLPQAQLTFFYRELSLPDAAAARFFRELSSVKGLSLIRLDREEPPALGDFDLLVAAEEFAGTPGSADLAARLRLSLDEAGFWKTLGQQLHPVNTAADGVYAVGCSRGPRDIQSAILDGQAAAGQILSRLIPGEQVALEPLTAWVEQEHCSGCRLCLERCPALALEWDPEAGTARINEFLCRGCGICAALCPGGAVHARHYENNQVAVEIRGLLHVENT